MTKPFYITTPIYYVNDKPHIGHAYTTIAVDVLARFYRLTGREAFMLTGTDEHGTKVAEAAEARNMTEIEFCDETAQSFIDSWKNLEIDNNDFIRTTSERHEKAVRKILDAMRRARTEDGKEVVYSDYYEGLYCTGCEKFLTERDLVDGMCPDHKKPPVTLSEKNYFFRLTAFTPKIKEKILSGELLILPEERRREVLGLIDQDLPDFSLSREKVKWGVPLSFDPSQVAYVWVDALTNYISAIGYADDEAKFNKWWNEGEVVHIMAKDILKFHCLYWPAMLMAAGIKLPETLFLHGFFTVDGEKMSKSLGNMIDPNEMIKDFGSDGTRYLLLTQYPFGVDGDIQAKRFVIQYNADLANDLGNLVSRVEKLIATNFDGKLPEPFEDIHGLRPLKALAKNLPDSVLEHMKNFRLHNAISETIALVKAANQFFDHTAPWKLAKEGKMEMLGGILNACSEVIRVVSIMLFPIMPTKMREMRSVFSLADDSLTFDNAKEFNFLKPGTSVKLKQTLFPRLKADDKDDSAKAKGKEKQKEKKAEKAVADTGLLDISEFGRAKLRVAEVVEAEKVEGADKLLKLQIDLGSEKRQIVAGVAEYYTPEQILGKKIVVVANLKPAKIRGVESNGMLLAARKDGKLVLVTTDGDIPPGADIS